MSYLVAVYAKKEPEPDIGLHLCLVSNQIRALRRTNLDNDDDVIYRYISHAGCGKAMLAYQEHQILLEEYSQCNIVSIPGYTKRYVPHTIPLQTSLLEKVYEGGPFAITTHLMDWCIMQDKERK